MKNLKNYTPHKVILLDSNNESILIIESEGSIRLSTTIETVGDINGIPLTKMVYWDCELPPFEKDTLYIVSLPVAQYAKNQGRNDFVIPWELVRSEDRSTVIWMKSLAVL